MAPSARQPHGLPHPFRLTIPTVGALVLTLLILLAGMITGAPPAHAADDTIRVTVTNDGQPVEGATVLVTGDAGEAQATTNADGQADVAVAGTGTYSITVDPATLPEGVTAPTSPLSYSKVSSGLSFTALKLGAAAGATGASPAPPASTAASSSASSAGTPAPAASATTATTTAGDADATSTDSTTGSFSHQLASKLIRGTVFGLILALASIGVSLIYGTTGLNNFAHGELVTFGGFVAYVAMSSGGLNGWLAVLIALVVGAGFGLLQNAAIWHPLRKKHVGLIQIMIVSIGLSLFLRYLFAFFFGPNKLVMPQSFDAEASPFGVSLSYWDVWGSVIAIVLLALVIWALGGTRLGKSIRAVADNKLLAATTGIHVERVIRVVWTAGAALAAVAGVLVAFYQTVSFQAGAQILLLVFAAVTLGGLGSAYGAVIGSLLLSWFIELSTFVIPTSMKTVAAMFVMIVILLVRPQGILGTKQRIG